MTLLTQFSTSTFVEFIPIVTNYLLEATLLAISDYFLAGRLPVTSSVIQCLDRTIKRTPTELRHRKTSNDYLPLIAVAITIPLYVFLRHGEYVLHCRTIVTNSRPSRRDAITLDACLLHSWCASLLWHKSPRPTSPRSGRPSPSPEPQLASPPPPLHSPGPPSAEDSYIQPPNPRRLDQGISLPPPSPRAPPLQHISCQEPLDGSSSRVEPDVNHNSLSKSVSVGLRPYLTQGGRDAPAEDVSQTAGHLRPMTEPEVYVRTPPTTSDVPKVPLDDTQTSANNLEHSEPSQYLVTMPSTRGSDSRRSLSPDTIYLPVSCRRRRFPVRTFHPRRLPPGEESTMTERSTSSFEVAPPMTTSFQQMPLTSRRLLYYHLLVYR